MENHPQLFVYKRLVANEEWFIVANFSKETVELEWSACDVDAKAAEIIIANYDDLPLTDEKIDVRPYEAFVLAFQSKR